MSAIAVLEEDDHLRETLRQALVSMGHTVTCARTIPTCMTLLNDREYDLLITDFFITSGATATPASGASLIIAVRYSGSTPNGLHVDPAMPIIAMSEDVAGDAVGDPLDLCAMLGANETIRKPFEIPMLRRAVQDALYSRFPTASRSKRRKVLCPESRSLLA